MAGQDVSYPGGLSWRPAFSPEALDDVDHAPAPCPPHAFNPLSQVLNPQHVDYGGGYGQQSLVRFKIEHTATHSMDPTFDLVGSYGMSHVPQPKTETDGHQQFFDNTYLQDGNIVQQNNFTGTPSGPSLLLFPPHNFNQNGAVATNNGHNNTIYNAAGQYQQPQFQAPYYPRHGFPDFTYGLQGFGRGDEVAAPPDFFGDAAHAQDYWRSNRTAAQGIVNQAAQAPPNAHSVAYTTSDAYAVTRATGPPLYTNLPRSNYSPAPVIIQNVLQPGVLLRDTTAFANRANDPDQTYGNQLTGRPPHNVEPPRHFDITIMEINTFFPRWFLLPEVAMRAQTNGWDRKEVAKAQLNAVGMLDNITEKNFQKAESRIQKCFSEGGKLMFQIPPAKDKDIKWSKDIIDKSNFPRDNLTAVNWHLRSYFKAGKGKREDHFVHIPLRDVWIKVPLDKWPQGADRGILTKCLEYARYQYYQNDWKLDTSHFSWIMEQRSLVQGQFETSQADVDAVARFKLAVPDPVFARGRAKRED